MSNRVMAMARRMGQRDAKRGMAQMMEMMGSMGGGGMMGGRGGIMPPGGARPGE
jgi:signal recognition particle subunit SRP54